MHNLFLLLTFVHESREKRFQLNSCLLDMLFFRKTHHIPYTMSKGMIKYGNVLFLVSSFIYFTIGAILYFGRQLTKFRSFIYGITDAKKKHCSGVELILQINKFNLPLMLVSSLHNYLNRNS